MVALAAIRTGKAPVNIWHQQLGHPHSKLLHVLALKNIIDILSWLNGEKVCSSCQMGKSCRLPLIYGDLLQLLQFKILNTMLFL